jgi:zinc protease
MNVAASYDQLTVSFQTLSQNRDQSLRLLKLALTDPHFAAPDVDRIREQLLAIIRLNAQDPDKRAALEWFKLAFGSHPYGNPSGGTLDSIAAITPDDLHAYVKRTFARDNLKIAVVGDIDATQLAGIVDELFGGLPATSDRKAIPDVVWHEGTQQKIVDMPNPQSVAQFGFAGLLRKDPDFIPGYILNYIVGGGGFASKLMQEVREKRGLAYSVYTYLYPLNHAGIFAGGVATENKEVGHSLDVIKAELDRIAQEGVSDKELEAAKDYLIGSFALRFDTSAKIADQLLAIQLEDLGIDYIDKRNAEIAAVTTDDIKRVARRLIETKNLIVTVVGKPEGISQVGL